MAAQETHSTLCTPEVHRLVTTCQGSLTYASLWMDIPTSCMKFVTYNQICTLQLTKLHDSTLFSTMRACLLDSIICGSASGIPNALTSYNLSRLLNYFSREMLPILDFLCRLVFASSNG